MVIHHSYYYEYHKIIFQKNLDEITLRIVIQSIRFLGINDLCALTTMCFNSTLATIIINESLRFYLTKLLNSKKCYRKYLKMHIVAQLVTMNNGQKIIIKFMI